MANSCFHGRFLSPNIEFMHVTYIPCEGAVVFFRLADRFWHKICQRYGEGFPEFWVVLDHNPQNPVIASCIKNGVYFNLGLLRTTLSLEEDIASRLIEELYHLHEWRVQGIEPSVPFLSDEKIELDYAKLIEYYSRDYKYRALKALVEMTNPSHWKEFLSLVEKNREKRS
ncbi:MAG: hypothetical protein BMS9Abin34_130 [Patescibacteria group bacterium]|nr:MAG: hypothetical protein BMS9Abin34_130 [Patescibacteria group bacterium]